MRVDNSRIVAQKIDSNICISFLKLVMMAVGA